MFGEKANDSMNKDEISLAGLSKGTRVFIR